MKKFILAIITLSTTIVFAQQNPQYSQYLRNQFLVNPAAGGLYDFTDITIGGRWQWLGFGDEPRTAYLAFNTVLHKKIKTTYNPAIRISNGPVRNPEVKTGRVKHSLGGMLIADQYGAFRKVQGSAIYSIHLPLSKEVNLAFGAKVGLSNNAFLREKAQVLNIVDPTQGYTDGTYDGFIADQSSKFILDIGAGLYLYAKGFFIGISADNLSKDFVEFGQGTANFNSQIHSQLIAGYQIPLSEDFSMTPSVLVKYMNPAPPTMEGSLQLEYKEWIWMAASYRHKDAVVGMLGLNLSERFKIGYSYDLSLSKFRDFSAGGHELILGVMLGR
jgi:type IX secretion system PorP/SprF family membrane protein